MRQAPLRHGGGRPSRLLALSGFRRFRWKQRRLPLLLAVCFVCYTVYAERSLAGSNESVNFLGPTCLSRRPGISRNAVKSKSDLAQKSKSDLAQKTSRTFEEPENISWDATRVVLSTSLVCLLLALGVSGYILVSSPKLSSEQLTYAAWYSKVADRVRALVAEKSSSAKKGPASVSVGKRQGRSSCRVTSNSEDFFFCSKN